MQALWIVHTPNSWTLAFAGATISLSVVIDRDVDVEPGSGAHRRLRLCPVQTLPGVARRVYCLESAERAVSNFWIPARGARG
jgi:hypothetical protein